MEQQQLLGIHALLSSSLVKSDADSNSAQSQVAFVVTPPPPEPHSALTFHPCHSHTHTHSSHRQIKNPSPILTSALHEALVCSHLSTARLSFRPLAHSVLILTQASQAHTPLPVISRKQARPRLLILYKPQCQITKSTSLIALI